MLSYTAQLLYPVLSCPVLSYPILSCSKTYSSITYFTMLYFGHVKHVMTYFGGFYSTLFYFISFYSVLFDSSILIFSYSYLFFFRIHMYVLSQHLTVFGMLYLQNLFGPWALLNRPEIQKVLHPSQHRKHLEGEKD